LSSFSMTRALPKYQLTAAMAKDMETRCRVSQMQDAFVYYPKVPLVPSNDGPPTWGHTCARTHALKRGNCQGTYATLSVTRFL